MPCYRCWMLFFLALPGVFPASACAGGKATTENLLPASTVGYIASSDLDNAQKRWNMTAIGKLMATKEMGPFVEDFKDGMQTQSAELTARLGLALADLKGVASGDAALAFIEPRPATAATALVMDVSGNVAKAQAVIDNAGKKLKSAGAKETLVNINGAAAYIYNVPIAGGAAAAPGAIAAINMKQTIYFLTQDWFGACDDLAVVKEITTRIAVPQAGSLADNAAFKAIMKRCAADKTAAKDPSQPQMRWFIYPLGYGEALRAATPSEKIHRGKPMTMIMRNQGFGEIQGVGGYLDLAAENNQYQLMHRTCVYAPKPYSNAMKMLVLPNGSDFTPQPWVAADIVAYTTFYIDILNAFDHFGTLYDEVAGEPGVWDQTLEGMITDPYGPKVDIRKELIMNLGKRVTMVSDCKLPIDTNSERLLWAIEVKDEKVVAKAIEKLVKSDNTIKRRMVDGHIVWEIVEEQESAVPSIELDVPSVTPKGKDAGNDDEKEAHFLPHGAFTVSNGQLYIATHIDFIQKVLKPIPPAEMLKNDPEFKKTWGIVDSGLGFSGQFARHFTFANREIRPAYELIQQGKMPQSQSLLGRILNTISGEAKKGAIRKQRIKGQNLPAYSIVEKAFGTGATGGSSEEAGWFYKGFLSAK